MPPTQPSPAAGVRAVVCDDSPFMRRFLADALAASGVDVVGSAADGDEALRACATLRPDVLTLDMQMPGRGRPRRPARPAGARPARRGRVGLHRRGLRARARRARRGCRRGHPQAEPDDTARRLLRQGSAPRCASAAVARRPVPMQRRPVPPAFRAPTAELRLARSRADSRPPRRPSAPRPPRRPARGRRLLDRRAARPARSCPPCPRGSAAAFWSCSTCRPASPPRWRAASMPARRSTCARPATTTASSRAWP